MTIPQEGQFRTVPPRVADERAMYQSWLEFHRGTLLWKCEEYARHNGHADLLRESIDGATGD